MICTLLVNRFLIRLLSGIPRTIIFYKPCYKHELNVWS